MRNNQSASLSTLRTHRRNHSSSKDTLATTLFSHVQKPHTSHAANINGSHYNDKKTVYQAISDNLRVTHSSYQKRDLPRSLMKKYQGDAVERAKERPDSKQREQKEETTLYDRPYRLAATLIETIDKQKLIQINQQALSKHIKTKLAKSETTPSLQYTLHLGSSHPNSSPNKPMKSRGVAKNTKTNSSINYLIHQFNQIYRLQQQIHPRAQQVSSKMFIEKCRHFKETVREGRYLRARVIEGIKTNGPLNVRAYIRFCKVVVAGDASREERAGFLEYFLMPEGLGLMDRELLRLILELLCEKSGAENPEEEEGPMGDRLSRLLLQSHNQQVIERRTLRACLLNSEELVDLLINLIKQ